MRFRFRHGLYTIDNPINGTPITVYNLSSAIKTLPTQSLYQTNAPQSLVRNTYTGYEFNMVSRLGGGRFVTVGYTLERQLGRNCVDGVTTAKPLQDPNSLRFCDQFGDPNLSFNGINIESLGAVAPPWSNSFVAQGSTPIRWGFVVSTSFQSNLYGTPAAFAGVDTNNGYLPRQLSIASAATSVYPNGCIGCQTLTSGQTCATVSAATVSCPIDPGFNSLQGSETVNLVSPGAVRAPRLTQWNVNIKRTFRIKEKLDPRTGIRGVQPAQYECGNLAVHLCHGFVFCYFARRGAVPYAAAVRQRPGRRGWKRAMRSRRERHHNHQSQTGEAGTRH